MPAAARAQAKRYGPPLTVSAPDTLPENVSNGQGVR